MKNKHPKWSEDAEIGFVEWYNDEYGTYSCRLEWFQGDCEVEDEKTRKDLMYKWIHAAYASGYERGLRTLDNRIPFWYDTLIHKEFYGVY